MSANALTVLDYFPVKFNIPNTPGCEECVTGDFCQKVEQKDDLCFEFLMGTCGDELITCGDFVTSDCTFANWGSGSSAGSFINWGWVAGQVIHYPGSIAAVKQFAILTSGKLYKVEITVNRVTNPLLEIVGSVTLKCGTAAGTTITKSGNYTQYIIANGVDFQVVPTTNFDGGIDDISIYEVSTDLLIQAYDENGLPVGTAGVPNTTQSLNGVALFCDTWESFELPDGCYTLKIIDGCSVGELGNQIINGGFFAPASEWIFGTNWSYDVGNTRGCHAGVGAGILAQALPNLQTGLTYYVNFTVINRTTGSVTPRLGGTLGAAISVDGVYSVQIVAGGTGDLSFMADTTFDGCIEDVQVILVNTSYPDGPETPCFDLRALGGHPCTKLLSWTNDENAFGADYETVWSPTGTWTPKLRIECILNKPTYPREIVSHRFSSGRRKMLRGILDKTWVLSFDQIPEYIVDALALGITHDHFYIDGVEYVAPEADVTPEWIKDHALTNISIEVQLQSLNLVNNNC